MGSVLHRLQMVRRVADRIQSKSGNVGRKLVLGHRGGYCQIGGGISQDFKAVAIVGAQVRQSIGTRMADVVRQVRHGELARDEVGSPGRATRLGV